jgi:hypothetical protein
MIGKYLRRLTHKPCDPTMTYMEDPYIVKVGDWLQDNEGYHRVLSIDEYRSDIRFAHLTGHTAPPNGAVIHDLRDE